MKTVANNSQNKTSRHVHRWSRLVRWSNGMTSYVCKSCHKCKTVYPDGSEKIWEAQ